jgi:hypothetical protein
MIPVNVSNANVKGEPDQLSGRTDKLFYWSEVVIEPIQSFFHHG